MRSQTHLQALGRPRAPPGGSAPGVDGLPTAVPENSGRLGVNGLVLEEVPLESVERVVLICADDGGQRLVQVLRLKLQRPERDCRVCYMCAQSCLTLCNPMDVACQASLSMEFSRKEYWSGLPFPSPGDLPDPGMELVPGSPEGNTEGPGTASSEPLLPS